jgi:hypothetical protein
VTLRLSPHFVSLLNANAQIRRLADRDELTAADQLALAVVYEARGAHEEQVDAAILHAWRDDLEIQHGRRHVDDDGDDAGAHRLRRRSGAARVRA